MINDGFVSRSFMQIVRAVLQEFGCEERDFNLDRASVKALDLLNHTQTLEDAMSVCKMYGILRRNEEIIKRMLVRQRAAYNMVEEDNYYILARAEKNEAYGIYYVTNAMRRTPEDMVISSVSLEEPLAFSVRRSGENTIFAYGNYYLKGASSVLEADIFSADDDKLVCTVCAEIGAGNKFKFKLKNNNSEYHIETDDGYICFYDMKYMNTLLKGELINTDKRVADLEWSPTDEQEDYISVGRLTLLKVSFDEAELLFHITAAIEEIYRRYMTSLNLDNSEIKRIRDELPYMELRGGSRY